MKFIDNISTLIVGCGLAAALSACKDSFDLDSLQNHDKLVVYCFPSQADTTYVSVNHSVGVKKYTDTRKTATLKDARVSYAVNGVPRTVQQADDGTFFVIGGHRPGDRVTIRAEHDDYAAAEAQTTVPQPVAVELKSVKEVSLYDSYWFETNDYHQLLATFTDPADTEDFYAVRVKVKGKNYQKEEGSAWAEVATFDEPLLQAISDIDSDFGYENDFYNDFYIFSDQTINGETYTLHLSVLASFGVAGYSADKQYQVLLYRIAPAYYRFLKSLNDVENNELAQGGFAQLMPTYTNVSQGIGVVGGYWQQASEWKRVEEK